MKAPTGVAIPPKSKGCFKNGRIEIDYDLGSSYGQRVSSGGIRVGGVQLATALLSVAGPTALFTYDARVEALLFELFEATWMFELAAPTESLAARDAADRIFEEVVSRQWSGLMMAKETSRAYDHALWALETCVRWEAQGKSSSKYVHKGAAYYWACTSAFALRNVDLGLMLLEAGDQSDSDTYKRAGLAEKGVMFPGRATLSLDPTQANMLYLDVMEMRKTLESWLLEFDSDTGLVGQDQLSLPECEGLVLKNESLRTEGRYLIAFLIWTNMMDRDPVFRSLRGSGPASRRRQAEWILGLLTATEGILKSVVPAADDYFDAVVRLIARDVAPTPAEKDIKTALGSIVTGFADDAGTALTYWAVWKPSGPTANFPWYVRWLEPGRFIRNQTSHALAASPAIEQRWSEVETTARYALFSALWLLKKATPPTPPLPPSPTTPTLLMSAVSGNPAAVSFGTVVPSGVAWIPWPVVPPR